MLNKTSVEAQCPNAKGSRDGRGEINNCNWLKYTKPPLLNDLNYYYFLADLGVQLTQQKKKEDKTFVPLASTKCGLITNVLSSHSMAMTVSGGIWIRDQFVDPWLMLLIKNTTRCEWVLRDLPQPYVQLTFPSMLCIDERHCGSSIHSNYMIS